jgi:hypothetical protein
MNIYIYSCSFFIGYVFWMTLINFCYVLYYSSKQMGGQCNYYLLLAYR